MLLNFKGRKFLLSEVQGRNEKLLKTLLGPASSSPAATKMVLISHKFEIPVNKVDLFPMFPDQFLKPPEIWYLVSYPISLPFKIHFKIGEDM